METLEINKESKLYLIGEFNDEENKQLENMVTKLKDFNNSIVKFESNVSLVIVKGDYKSIYESEEEINKLYDILLNIDDDGLKDILNNKNSKFTKLIFYINTKDILYSLIRRANLAFSDPEDEIEYYHKIIKKGNIKSINYIFYLDILYQIYGEFSLLSKYDNIYDLYIEPFENKNYRYINISVKYKNDDREKDHLTIFIQEDNNCNKYDDTISNWEAIVNNLGLYSKYSELYILTATKDNLKSIVSCAEYLSKPTTVYKMVAIISDLPDEEIKKYDFILQNVKVYHDAMSLLTSITYIDQLV